MNSWGIIGIGRIGLSMARNMSSKGITVSLYDKAYEKKTNLIFEEKELYSELNKASFFIDISSFIKSIEKPRKLLILVPAGEPTDHVINNLLDILDEDDITNIVIEDFYNNLIEVMRLILTILLLIKITMKEEISLIGLVY